MPATIDEIAIADIPPDRPARLWGLTFAVRDIDRLGDAVTPPRPAVQEGRRIATLRREAGAAIPLAFMTA